MSNERGVVILGYGLAGRVFHQSLISATPGLRIRAIVTADALRREQALADVPGVRLHATAEEAWQDLDDIEIAVIAGANRTHLPQALAAVSRGLHIVIDKPMAANAVEAQQIITAAAASGVQAHPFQNRRLDSDFLTLQSLVASGELGTAHRFESRIERLRMLPKGNWRESADPSDLGGVLLDFGAHLVDQAIELLGPVHSVVAYARSVRDSSAANDDMQITLRHTTGALSNLVGSQAAAFGEPRFQLMATAGAMRIDGSDSQEAALRAGISPADGNWGQEPDTAVATVRTATEDGVITETARALLRGQWNTYYPAVLNAINGMGPAPVRAADAVANLQVLDAATLSASRGETVTLSPAVGHG
jgi:scyllo-inositol 2-dehydrogenase (NADP+)